MAAGTIIKRPLAGGKVRWDVYFDLPREDDGKRRQRKRVFTTRREAQEFLTTQRAEIAKGVAVDRSEQTIADLMNFWLDTYARHNVSPKTFQGYSDTIKNHIIPVLGRVEVQKLTPAMLQSFYSSKLAAGCGPRTVRLVHLHLDQALTQAMTMGLVARNVSDVVTAPRARPRDMDTWTAEQARAFLRAAHSSAHGPIWVVALATGMRRGELLGLRWRDVDFERGTLSVRQTVGLLRGVSEFKKPKTKSSVRDIPVQPEVLDALRAHKIAQNEQRLAKGSLWHDYGLVFTSEVGTPIHGDNLRRDYDRLVTRAGVPRIRIHDLRHSHVTLAIAAGANIKAVSQRVGHSNVHITLGTYAHVMPSQHVEVSDKVGAVLFGPS